MNRRIYYPGLILLLMLAVQSAPPAAQSPAGKLSPALAMELASLPSGETRPVWVYLTDKGFEPDSPGLIKKILQERAQSMRERCLHRRAKARTGQEMVDFEDIAVFPAYAERIRAMVPRVRTVSRWLNALSVEAGREEVEALSSLGFVRRLEPVASFQEARRGSPNSSSLPLPLIASSTTSTAHPEPSLSR